MLMAAQRRSESESADERGRARIVSASAATFGSRRRHERGIDLYDDIVERHQHLAGRVLFHQAKRKQPLDIAMHV